MRQLGKRHVPASAGPVSLPQWPGCVCVCVPGRPFHSVAPHVFLAPLAVSRTYARKYTDLIELLVQRCERAAGGLIACLPCLVVGSWLWLVVTSQYPLCSLVAWRPQQQPCVSAGRLRAERNDMASRWFSSQVVVAAPGGLALGAPTRPRWQI